MQWSHASVGLAQACPNKTLAAKLHVLQTVGTRHDYHRIHSDVSSFPQIDTSWLTTNLWKTSTVMEYEHIAIQCVHPLNVICGWSLHQHNTEYPHKKRLISINRWICSTGVFTLDVTSFRFNGNATWMALQSYKSFQACHGLVCEIHQAYHYTSWLCKSAPAYLKIALRTPHLFVGQLVLFFHTYHTCNNHII